MSKFPVYETLTIKAESLCQHNKIPKNIKTIFFEEKPIRLEDKTRLKKIGAHNTWKECEQRGKSICQCRWKSEVVRQRLEDTKVFKNSSIFSIDTRTKNEGFNNYLRYHNTLTNPSKNINLMAKFRRSCKKSKSFWNKPKIYKPEESVTWIMRPPIKIKSSSEQLQNKCNESSYNIEININQLKGYTSKTNLKSAKSSIPEIKIKNIVESNNQNESLLPPAQTNWDRLIKVLKINNNVIKVTSKLKNLEQCNKNEIELKKILDNSKNHKNKTKRKRSISVKKQTTKKIIKESPDISSKIRNRCKKTYVLAERNPSTPTKARTHQSFLCDQEKNQGFIKKTLIGIGNKSFLNVNSKSLPSSKQYNTNNLEKFSQSRNANKIILNGNKNLKKALQHTRRIEQIETEAYKHQKQKIIPSSVNKKIENEDSNDPKDRKIQSYLNKQIETKNITDEKDKKSLKNKQVNYTFSQPTTKPQINIKLKHFKEYHKTSRKIKSFHKLNSTSLQKSNENITKNTSNIKSRSKLALKYFKEKDPSHLKQLRYPLIRSILQQYPKHLLPVVHYSEFQDEKPLNFQTQTKVKFQKTPASIEFFNNKEKTKFLLNTTSKVQQENLEKQKAVSEKFLTLPITQNITATSSCYSKTLARLTNFGKNGKPKLVKSNIMFNLLKKSEPTCKLHNSGKSNNSGSKNINQLLLNAINKAYETEINLKRYLQNRHFLFK